MRELIKYRVCCALLGMLVFVGLSGIGSQALASTFSACVAEGTVGCEPGASPASGTFSSNSNGNGSASATAFSDGGILSGSALASSTGSQVTAVNGIAASFRARAIIDDLIISGPATEASIQVSANIHGLIVLSGSSLTSATSIVGATLQIKQPLVTGSLLARYEPSIFTSGTNTEINITLTTTAVILPTDTPLTVEMVLEGNALAMDNRAISGSANASVDFLNTMSFPTSSPVFILPEGFTANSVSGNIVDNQFVGVPEPTTLALAAFSLVGMCYRLRRRQ